VRRETALQHRLGTGLVQGQKHNAHAQQAIVRQGDPRLVEQKFARDRGHDADAVAALAVGGSGSAMRQTAERRQCIRQDGVRRDARGGGDESDATGVAIEA
jgi:hypothetical protein